MSLNIFERAFKVLLRIMMLKVLVKIKLFIFQLTDVTFKSIQLVP